MTVYMLSSLFIFASYTANITALLQSPSNYINTVRDVVESSFDVAVTDAPFVRNLVQDDTSPEIVDLRNKKLKQWGEEAHISAQVGVKRVRDGLVAFQCDLSEAYKLVSDTYTEYDKCGLKEIADFKGATNGPAVPKKSPYKEIQKQKYMYFIETGLTRRAIKRFTPIPPTCQSNRAKFSSIGNAELSSIFNLWLFGIGLSVAILLVEKLIAFHNARGFQKVLKPFNNFHRLRLRSYGDRKEHSLDSRINLGLKFQKVPFLKEE